MTRPLYDNGTTATLERDGNFGLWYQRFFDHYDNEFKGIIKPSGTDAGWLEKGFDKKKTGNGDALERHTQRQSTPVSYTHLTLPTICSV